MAARHRAGCVLTVREEELLPIDPVLSCCATACSRRQYTPHQRHNFSEPTTASDNQRRTRPFRSRSDRVETRQAPKMRASLRAVTGTKCWHGQCGLQPHTPTPPTIRPPHEPVPFSPSGGCTGEADPARSYDSVLFHYNVMSNSIEGTQKTKQSQGKKCGQVPTEPALA
jgi:hypothetical protein